MKRLKTGVIGLGQIAQLAHFPSLEVLFDKYEVVSIADISRGLLKFMGDRYSIGARYENAEEMIEKEDIDAVLILSGPPFSVGYATAAAKRGMHVFIEKPMALNLSLADAMIRAKKENNVKIMVGYMRTYDPAFLQCLEEIKKLGKINYVKVRDFLGANEFFTDQGAVTHRFDDIPEEAKASGGAAAKAQNIEALGDVSKEIYSLYGLLTGISVHDISAMRTAFGMPKRAVSAEFWNESFLNVLFEYEGFYASYEIGVDRQRRFDASIEVYGEEKTIKVKYDTPYLLNLPSYLTIGETKGDGYVETVIRPTYVSSFQSELELFYDCIINDVEPSSGPEEARRDLEIFKMITDKAAN